jgi:hypothetical protein
MGSPLTANKSGLVPLFAHLDFDIKGILTQNTKTALAFAQHTVRRLNEMRAPEWAYKKLLTDCFFVLPELNAGWIIQAQARDFFVLVVECGKHASNAQKDEIILIARRFRDYVLLEETVAALYGRPLSAYEFLETAEMLHVASREFSEIAGLLCLDAYKAHGVDLRNAVKEILKQKHAAWKEVETEELDAIPV